MSGPRIRRRGDGRGGLPSRLPANERILWQGSPDHRVLARRVLHVRKVAFYLALMLCWFAVSDYGADHAGRTLAGFACLALLAAAAIGVLILFAILMARTTTYTLTNQRVVIRYGIALTMSINLPLRLVEQASLRLLSGGCGDIPMAMIGRQKLGYAVLWPHARPWRLSKPEPMLRAVPDAVHVAGLLADALAATSDEATPVARTEPVADLYEHGLASLGEPVPEQVMA